MKISLFKGVLIGLFALAAMIGLYVFATNTSNKVNNTNTVGTVLIWGTLPKEGVLSALAKIVEKNTALKDVSYVQKDEATLPADLAAAIATGNAPDLVLASSEEIVPLRKLISPISLTTLPAATFSATFIGEGGLLVTPEGTGYYGVPFLVDPLILFSNRALLSSSGIVKPPTTWEALAGLVPSVLELTPTKQITRSLIALGTYGNVRNARGILSSLFLQVGLPISGYANGLLVAVLNGASTDSISPGQAVLSFYTQFADPSKVSYTWNASLGDSRQAFLNGDLALYPGYASEARFLAVANPNLDFLATPLPEPATAKLKSVYGLLYSFMIPLGAKNPDGAYQTAALLTNTVEQNISASATGLAPASLEALTVPPGDPVASVAYAEALYARGWLSPAPSATDQIFSSIITGVITGRSDIATTLTSGESSLTALLQK